MKNSRRLHKRLDALDDDVIPPVVCLRVGLTESLDEAYSRWREDHPADAAKVDRWKVDPVKSRKLPPPFVIFPSGHPDQLKGLTL